MGRALVTGFPSFFARKLVDELLEDEATTVVVLVPEREHPAAEEAANLSRDRTRVELVSGEAGAIDFGLAGAHYLALAKELTVAHYVPTAELAAARGTEKKPEHVRRGYVAMAREALAFASVAENLGVSVLHSSVDVAGNHRGLFSEGDLAKGQRFTSAGAEGRAIAESMFRRKMPDLPLCVVRPTVVIGDSRTGEFDELDGLYLLILLVVTSPPDFTLPLPGRGDQLLNLVPVDYVVRAARRLGELREARGRTFHLGDPSPCSALRVFELVSQVVGRRGPRGFIPANLTRALLRAPGIERIARSPRAFLEALVREGSYGFANTEALLGDSLRCPPFESYVETLVRRVEDSVKAKNAPRESLGDVEDTLL